MGCVLDMTVPPDILLNHLHGYGNRLTTSSVADTDATDPHFLVDSGASIHLISQSLVDEGYLQICREWAVNERCTTANGQEMILNRCVEAEFSTYALKSRHVSFLDCDGAAASSPDAASPVAASSRAAAPSPAAPASSSLSPVSRSICAGSQLQRPQKLRVTGLIGYGQVSLLSVALLASKGWTFSCSPGKNCSRTSREVDKPAKPPCLSLSHFGGHDQVPNRTKSSRTHLDIFLWCNVPWISIVHPGAIDIDMSSSLHSLHYTSDVDSSSRRVVRYSTMREAVQDSVLHVAEREGSSSVHERIDCADPVQPRFRRVEHAFGCLGRYHGVEQKEQSPDTVREETAEPAPGTVIAQAGQPDVEKDPSEPREETRRVVLVTMEPEESTEVIVKPPEQEPERSTEAAEKPTEPVEKEKGLEMEKRESEVPKDLPEPESPEKPFVAEEAAQEATSEQEVTFRMKAWSNWLHRQDQKDEEKRVKNRARQRALRQQRRSDRAAGLQQAVRKGPSLRRSWTVTVDDPLPKGSVRKVLKHHTKAPRRERIVKLRLIEREVQASRVTAKGKYMIQNKHRAWIAPKARPQPKSSGSRVKKEFIEIKPQRGVTMVSLTGSEASDVGDMEEISGALPESAPTPSEGPKSRLSSGLTGQERITSETIVRIGTTPEGEVVAKRQEIKPGTAYFMMRRPQEKENVKFTSQVRSLLRPAGNAALSVTDASTSEWMSETADPPVLELTEENLKRLDESVRKRKTPSIMPIKAKSRLVGPQPPPGPPPGWQDPVGDRPEETASPAGTKPKEPASPVSVDPEKMLAVIAQTEIPEPKTPPIPGPKAPPTPTTRPKAKSRPLTEEQKAVADEVLAQKARDLLKAAERGTGTLREEKASTASGSGAKRVPKYLAHLTDEEREQLFRSELASERQAGAIEWEKELTRQAKEEEERRKAKALYRSERMAQALEHGKEVQRRRQEEFEKGKQDLLQWRAEEEDRENLRKARRISLEQPAVPPTSGGVVLTPAPTAALEENPSTPPEALQAPLSEEEIAYRKQLQEHLSKFSDKRADAK